MNKLQLYINNFLDELQVWEDINHKTNYKENIKKAICQFLAKPNNRNANKLCKNFLRTYWLGIQDKHNPYLILIGKIREYEKNVGKLLKKQRDHYIHSVFVFILGLAIYYQNKKYQNIFNKYIMKDNVYKDAYTTRHEEFFYRWGLTSLFHDIGYPLEISLKQSQRYLKFITSYLSQNDYSIKMTISKFCSFVKLSLIFPSTQYKNEFFQKYPNLQYANHKNALMLLVENLHKGFDFDFQVFSQEVENFLKLMQKKGFIDHGFYGAIILLKWCHFLINKEKWNPAYFYFPVVDAASAIFLHNYYSNVMQNPPFNFRQMDVNSHPLGFLLILSDELQEWNRQHYGEIKIVNSPTNFAVEISDTNIKIKYFSKKIKLSGKEVSQKVQLINKILNIKTLFAEGITINEFTEGDYNG